MSLIPRMANVGRVANDSPVPVALDSDLVVSGEQVLHEEFLPYSARELLDHFLDTGRAGEEPERHLNAWKKRISDAAARINDPTFLDRDETLWTAGALLAIHRSANSNGQWREVLIRLFGSLPPIGEQLGWDDLLDGDLRLFFEVGLSSPAGYRAWLRDHLADRHPLTRQLAVSRSRGASLEGRTHLDALLLNPATGFAVHFEAKVLSDIDTKTKHDSLRNQLARNIDCVIASASPQPVLGTRRPERSFLVLLTPAMFKTHWSSRLYGHLVREYASDPSAIKRDLPHHDFATCAGVSKRIGWLTFEDIRTVQPTACPWLSHT
jgi:hypothetical protein